MSDRLRARTGQTGFTLVEAVVAIVIIGIVGGTVAVFMKAPINSYFDTIRRAALTDAADGAVRRISRDVRTALPNSIRGPAASSSLCFEFLPTAGGGRYRTGPKSDGTGDILDFSAADSSFDVLAGNNMPSSFSTTYHAVIYNLGISGADAYDSTGHNRAQIGNAATANNIVLAAANQFPLESPGKRFKVIRDHSVVYAISDGALMRQVRSPLAPSHGQLAACPATTKSGCTSASNCSILAGSADIAVTGSFEYTAAADTRNGLLAMSLVITQQGESVRLYQEVHVSNAP